MYMYIIVYIWDTYRYLKSKLSNSVWKYEQSNSELIHLLWSTSWLWNDHLASWDSPKKNRHTIRYTDGHCAYPPKKNHGENTSQNELRFLCHPPPAVLPGAGQEFGVADAPRFPHVQLLHDLLRLFRRSPQGCETLPSHPRSRGKKHWPQNNWEDRVPKNSDMTLWKCDFKFGSTCW